MIDYRTFTRVIESLQKRIHRVEVREEPTSVAGTVVFARGATVENPTAPTQYIVWRCTEACTATAVRGYRKGGTGATVNARKNNTDNLLAVALSITSADTWISNTVLQNASFVVGDELEIMIVTVAGDPTEVAVQIDFTVP